MDDSGQPGDAPGGGGNPPTSRDGDAWADRDRDSGTQSAWHRSRYANLLTPIVPASRQPRQQVNGSAEVHSTSAPPYPYEGDLEDAAQPPPAIPTQAPPWPGNAPSADPDWRGWAPPAGADEPLPEPPSPWAPGWAPDGRAPEGPPPPPPADGTVLPGPFATAFPPAPPVRFRPRQDEPPAPPPPGGFPPIGAVAAGAPTDHDPPGPPSGADPAPTSRRPEWAPEWPWSPAPPPAPTSPAAAGRLPVPAPRPTQPDPPTAAPTSPDDDALPSRRDFQSQSRNTLPGYIRGGAGPSGDDARFTTGSHPTVSRPSGGFPVVEPERGRVERTESGSFPVVDRRSAGLSRSFPASEPTDPPVTPGRLTRAFPGGEGAPTGPQNTPLTGAFPGGDRVAPVDPAGADRPTDLSGRRTAGPVPPAADAGPGDSAPPRPPLRLASRNGDPIDADPPRPRPVQPAPDRAPRGFAGPTTGEHPVPPRAFPGAPTSGGPGGEQQTGGFAAGGGAQGGFPGAPTSGGPGGEQPTGGFAAGGGAQGGFPGTPTSGGPAGEATNSGFPVGDGAQRAFPGRPTSGGPVGERDTGGFPAGAGNRPGFDGERPAAGGGFNGDAGGGGFARGGFAGDEAGGAFGGTRAASGYAAAERANGGFGGETTNGGFGDEPPPIPLKQRPIDRPSVEQRSVVDDMIDELSGLPQRVPAEPDVPTVPEPPSDTPADPPQLARIATHLRRPDLPEERDRPDGFDVEAILAAVRGVAGVKDASLRTTPAGAHSLRLDLSDGADPADISRHVARLLQERMGLAAAPQNLPGMTPAEYPPGPLGGDTPPTGFTRSGGYMPPPPAEPATRQAMPTRPGPRPPEPTKPAPRAPEQTRPTLRPIDRPNVTNRPGEQPAAPSHPTEQAPPERTSAADGRTEQPGVASFAAERSGVADRRSERTNAAGFPSDRAGVADPRTEQPGGTSFPAEPAGPADGRSEHANAAGFPSERASGADRRSDQPGAAGYAAEQASVAERRTEQPGAASYATEQPDAASRAAERTAAAPRPAVPAERAETAARPVEDPAPALRPAEPADALPATPAQPPGFEPHPDPAERTPGSHRGRAQVGGQSGVDTRDLAERAAATAAAKPVSSPPQHGEPLAERPEPPAHRRPADEAERGHLYGTRDADLRTSADQPASGSFPEIGSTAGIIGNIGGHPVTAAATAYSGGQISTTESAPSRPLNPGATPGPRVVIDHVQVSTFGLDATVETRLAAGKQVANGLATGPAVDGYVLRLCAVSAATAIDELLRTASRADDRGRCFVEHAAVVPFGNCEVAVVVVLLVCGGWVEQLAGSALVSGDPRQAVVRATLAAVNRRLEALLSD